MLVCAYDITVILGEHLCALLELKSVRFLCEIPVWDSSDRHLSVFCYKAKITAVSHNGPLQRCISIAILWTLSLFNDLQYGAPPTLDELHTPAYGRWQSVVTAWLPDLFHEPLVFLKCYAEVWMRWLHYTRQWCTQDSDDHMHMTWIPCTLTAWHFGLWLLIWLLYLLGGTFQVGILSLVSCLGLWESMIQGLDVYEAGRACLAGKTLD